MSLTKFITIRCDVRDCQTKTPLIDLSPYADASEEENIRADQGFASLDIPNASEPNIYICGPCWKQLVGYSKG